MYARPRTRRSSSVNLSEGKRDERNFQRGPARSLLISLCVAGSSLLGFVAAAYAVDWNSSGSPLTVTGYGSTGKGYGQYYVSTASDGTKYRCSARVWLNNADNHKVHTSTDNYVNAGVCLAPKYLSCTQKYYYYSNMQSSHINAVAWTEAPLKAPVTATADYARGYIQVKLDVPWRSDPESGYSLTNGVPY